VGTPVSPYLLVSFLAGATLFGWLIVVWCAVKVRKVQENRRVAAAKRLARRGIAVENATPTPPRPMPAVGNGARSREVLARPPEIETDDGPVNLRDWLIHYTRNENAWPEVVAKMYERAAEHPAVASYFHDIDMEELQQHFTSLLVLVAKVGVTSSNVVRMAMVHANVTNTAGIHITGESFDTVIGELAGILGEVGVPEATIAQLGSAVQFFRDVIVKEE
jgi:hemoglobin